MNGAALAMGLLRLVLLLIAQVLVFNQVGWGWGGKDYLFIFVGPLFIALLPLRAARPLVILLSFALGLGIDFFSETLGVHAGAHTFTAYCRPLLLGLLEPREGYNLKARPNIASMGSGWMARYLAALLLVYCIAFFLLQTFSFYFIGELLLKTALSLPASFIVLFILVLFFNPRRI